MVKTQIIDGASKAGVEVTSKNELAVSSIRPSTPVYNLVDVINTPYLISEPKAERDTFITGLVLNADRNVGSPGSVIELYSTATKGATSGDNIFTFELVKNASIVITPINVKIDEGLFLYIKASDTDINSTTFFYQV